MAGGTGPMAGDAEMAMGSYVEVVEYKTEMVDGSEVSVWKVDPSGEAISSDEWDWDLSTTSPGSVAREVDVYEDGSGYWAEIGGLYKSVRVEGLPVYKDDSTGTEYQYDAILGTLTPLLSGYIQESQDPDAMMPTMNPVGDGLSLIHI